MVLYKTCRSLTGNGREFSSRKEADKHALKYGLHVYRRTSESLGANGRGWRRLYTAP